MLALARIISRLSQTGKVGRVAVPEEDFVSAMVAAKDSVTFMLSNSGRSTDSFAEKFLANCWPALNASWAS